MSKQTDGPLKTVQVDGKQLAKLRKLLRVKTDEEALQIAIDQTLAAEDAIEAARKLRERGTFGRSWDEIKKIQRRKKATA
jgi:hypothetical protein